jgi:hypothetical protein
MIVRKIVCFVYSCTSSCAGVAATVRTTAIARTTATARVTVVLLTIVYLQNVTV